MMKFWYIKASYKAFRQFSYFSKKKKKTAKRPKRAENGKEEIYSLNLQCETVLINTTIECLNQLK